LYLLPFKLFKGASDPVDLYDNIATYVVCSMLL